MTVEIDSQAAFAETLADAKRALAVGAWSDVDAVLTKASVQAAHVVGGQAHVWFLRGALAHGQGNIRVAAHAFKLVLKENADDARAWAALAAIAIEAGQLAEGLRMANRAMQIDPLYVPAMSNKVLALLRLGRYEVAFRSATALFDADPDNFTTQVLFAEALLHANAVNEALKQIESALSGVPDHPDALLLQAVLLNRLHNASDTAASVERLLTALAGQVGLMVDFGARAQRLAAPYVALPLFKAAAMASPSDLSALVNLGITLQALGKPVEAIYYLRHATELDCQCAPAWYHLALCHFSTRNWLDYDTCLDRCLDAESTHADACAQRASRLKEQGKLDEALALLHKAIASRPGWAVAHCNLINFLSEAGRFEEAGEALVQARRNKVPAVDLAQTHGSYLLKKGEIAEANRIFRRILRSNPGSGDAMSGLLFCLNYDPHLKPAEVANAYRDWNQRFALHLENAGANFQNQLKKKRRKLRIGYVSGDFRGHSVAFFFEPILRNHDRKRFDVYCYANQRGGDAVTGRMMSYGDTWRWIIDFSDDAVENMIRSDGIDILVDLSNHTAYNRLQLFARRVAPVQMTAIGMPTTTGLTAMDWRVTDAYMDPVGMTEHLHSEKLLRVSSGWCYQPPDDGLDLPVQPSPAAHDKGQFTFASFNAFGKVNVQVLRLWGRVLEAVPQARLMLATGVRASDEHALAHIRSVCQSVGMPLERLELMERLPMKAYLEKHHEVDLILDSFPYTGATVSAHALWMGVPVLTLSGPSPINRSATSMMSVLGLQRFAVATKAAYVQEAVYWTEHVEELNALRLGMRKRMMRSPLMDGAKVTKELEHQYREVWLQRCAKEID